MALATCPLQICFYSLFAFLDTDFNSTVVEGVVPANLEMTFGIEIFDNQKVEREENFVIILNSTSVGDRDCAQGLIPATARNDLPCERKYAFFN